MERVHWVHWLISSSRTLPFPIQINVSLLLLSATRATAKISCSMQHWSRLSARLKLHSFCFFELESGTGCSYIKPRVKTFCTCETPFILFLRTGICIRCRFKKPNQVLDAAIKSQGPKLSARVKLAQLASSIHSECLCFRELETVYIQIRWSYNKPRTETICTCETRPAELIHISYNEERPPPTQCTWNRMPH